jgi:predicted RNA methylase
MTSRIKYNNPKGADELCLSYHYELLADHKRVIPFKKTIERTCKNHRVLESGVGSGIFSILAAKTGASVVYAVEKDPVIAKFALKNIKKCGLEERVKFIHKDTREVSLKDLDNEKVDVVIAENLSTWQITEPQIPVLNHINKHLLKEDGIVIPEEVYNYIELSQSQFLFEDLIELRSHYFQFSGIKEPLILSEKCLFSALNFKQLNPTKVDKTIKVKVTQNKTLNSVRLTSPLKLYENITFSSSDSLMPPVIIPLTEDIEVSKGNTVELNFQFSITSGWDNVTCKARIIN